MNQPVYELENATEGPRNAAAAATDAAPTPGKGTLTEQLAGDGDFQVERVAVLEAAPAGPAVPTPNDDAVKGDISAAAGQLPAKGGAEELENMPPLQMPAVEKGGGGDAPVAPEVAASIENAKNDTRDAVSKSEADANAYKADMGAQRDRFDAEQHATMLEKLKTMTPVEKRQQLQEMGYDPNDVRKMSDADLDRIIEDKMDTEARKTRILGMDPDQLKALTPGQKIQYLVDLGIERGDLDKVGQGKATKLFDDVMAVAHVPGKHEVKIKISSGFLGLTGRSWTVSVNCDADGNTDIQAKKEGGFLSKLWGWIKLALPIILTVLAPLTAGASLIVLAIYQTATAIKNGDWLGAVIGAAGALIGVGAIMAAKGAVTAVSGTFSKIAQVAAKVKSVAQAAQAAMAAAKAKNAGSLMGALAAGASLFAKFSAESAENFSNTMQNWSDRLKKWGDIISGGEKVASGIKGGDPLAAIGGAFDTVAASVSNKDEEDGGSATKNLTRAAGVTNFIDTGRRALQSSPPNYAMVAEAAMGIAGTLKQSQKLEDAARLTGAAGRLKAAWDNRDKDPGGLAAAAFDVASAIQVAKYDINHKDDAEPDPKDRAAMTNKYQQASRIVSAAGAVLTAATTKPRPNYMAGVDAATQLIAELTSSKKLDQAAALTRKLDAWTAAVASKNEMAIIAAGGEIGDWINDLRKPLTDERDTAKKDAQKTLAPGETLPETDEGEIPPLESHPIDIDPLAPLPAGTTGSKPSATLDDQNDADVTGTDHTGTDDRGTGTDTTADDRAAMPHFETSVTVKPEPPRFETSVTVTPEPAPPHFETSVTVTPEGATEGPTTEAGKDSEGGHAGGEGGDGHEEAFSPEVQELLHVIEAFSEWKFWGNAGARAGLNEIVKIADLVESLHAQGKTATVEFRQATAALLLLKQSSKFASIVVAELSRWAAYGTNLSPGKNVAMQLAEFSRTIGSAARVVGVADKFFTFAEDAVIVWGYTPSGGTATIPDRVTAAGHMALIGATLSRDVPWVAQLAETLIRKYGTMAVVDAMELIKRSAAKFGDGVVRTVVKWTEPIITKIAETEGGEVMMAAARRVAATVGEWALSEAGEEALALCSQTLAVNIGLAFRIALGPAAIVLPLVAQLEVKFATELFSAAKTSFSMVFSAQVFGKQANTLKSEIQSKPTGTAAQCDALFRYAYSSMLTGKADVRNGWPPYARDKIGAQFKGDFGFQQLFPTQPVQALLALPDDMKTIFAGQAVKDAALAYIDQEYKRVFGIAP